MIDEKKLIDELKRMINSDEVAGYSPAAVIHSVCEKIWEQPKVGEWIPTTERLPEEKGSYLFTTTGYGCARILILSFDPDDEMDAEIANTGVDLVAWMPLPEAYREEKTNETD